MLNFWFDVLNFVDKNFVFVFWAIIVAILISDFILAELGEMMYPKRKTTEEKWEE